MYYPNLKTSDAELRAIKQLSNEVKREIVPIFELTRSRKTKLLPTGSLTRRIEQLQDAYGSNPFILDLCTQQELMNEQTIELFNEFGGYRNWIRFLSEHTHQSIVPCLLYEDQGSKENFQEQARELQKRYGTVCLRTSASDELAQKLMIWACEAISESNLIACGLLYFIEHGRIDHYKGLCSDYMREVVGNRMPNTVIFPASSFPRYITDLPNCEDASGSFESSELALDAWLKEEFPSHNIQHSDFASVHPIRYPASGGNWIPRIDLFDGQGFRYVRTRRDDGGYKEAAKSITTSELNKVENCWGQKQIESAISGSVTGRSPSYWISVRINCWISKRANIH